MPGGQAVALHCPPLQAESPVVPFHILSWSVHVVVALVCAGASADIMLRLRGQLRSRWPQLGPFLANVGETRDTPSRLRAPLARVGRGNFDRCLPRCGLGSSKLGPISARLGAMSSTKSGPISTSFGPELASVGLQ